MSARFIRGVCLTFAVASCAAPSREMNSSSSSEIREVSPGEDPTGSCAQLSWPLSGVMSSPFGRREGRPHEGIDIAVPEGTQVHAACDGVVVYANDKLRGYGRLIIVKHTWSGGTLATVYAHNRKLLVKEGDAVARGQLLAFSGQTGHATAPHLHFEVRANSQPTDPIPFLRLKRVHGTVAAAPPSPHLPSSSSKSDIRQVHELHAVEEAHSNAAESQIRLLSGP